MPLILVAMVGAYFRMHNLSAAKADDAASLATLKEPLLWILATLYIGTFGSFIGLHGPSRTRKITPGSRDVCP